MAQCEMESKVDAIGRCKRRAELEIRAPGIGPSRWRRVCLPCAQYAAALAPIEARRLEVGDADMSHRGRLVHLNGRRNEETTE